MTQNISKKMNPSAGFGSVDGKEFCDNSIRNKALPSSKTQLLRDGKLLGTMS